MISSGLISIIVAFISGVIGPVAVRLILKRVEQKKDPLNEAFVLGEKVSEKLEQIQETYKCDRIYILQFHNGGHYYPTGKSIQKFSMFYELVKDVKYSVRNSFQNVPVNMFSKSLRQLSQDDFIAISDYKDPSVATFGLKYIAEENGSRASYIYAIRNIDDKLIGVMGLEYVKKIVLDPVEVQNLRIDASIIGGELSKYLQSK